MLHILIIAAALAIHASAGDDWLAPVNLDHLFGRAWGPLATASVTLLPLLSAAALVHALCRAAGRDIDRTGSPAPAAAADRACALLRTGACLWTGLVSLTLAPARVLVEPLIARGLPQPLAWAAGELAMLALLGVLLAASWWSFAPIERRFRHAVLMRTLDRGQPIWPIPSRPAYTLSQLRNHALWILIPITVLLLLSRALAASAAALAAAARAGAPWAAWLPPWTFAGSAERLSALFDTAGLVIAIILMPLLQRRVWDTIPLGPGPIRDAVSQLCARAGTRVRRILVWRTRGLSFNAVVLGALPRFRYLIFTDALLESLTLQHVRAVAAHEIGHLRRHHVPWLILGLGAALALTTELGVRLAQAQGLTGPRGDLAALLLALSLSFPLMAFISRRFEWQADADAARLLSDPDSPVIEPRAAAAVASALAAIASLNHVDPDARSWRHGSINTRRARLADLAGRPAETLPIDRAVAAARLAILAAWLLLAAASFL